MKARALFGENEYITGVSTLTENHKKREDENQQGENHVIAEVRTTLSGRTGSTK